MIEISNRQFEQLLDKLPRLIEMARKQELSLKQQEDIRQLRLLYNQLQKKRNCKFNNKNQKVMTRKEIAKELANHSNLTPSQAVQAVEGIVEIIADALAKDEPILLRGFGTIKTVQRAARPARNISKGTTMMLPPTKQVKFIAYNELKERINHHGRYAILP